MCGASAAIIVGSRESGIEKRMLFLLQLRVIMRALPGIWGRRACDFAKNRLVLSIHGVACGFRSACVG